MADGAALGAARAELFPPRCPGDRSGPRHPTARGRGEPDSKPVLQPAGHPEGRSGRLLAIALVPFQLTSPSGVAGPRGTPCPRSRDGLPDRDDVPDCTPGTRVVGAGPDAAPCQ